MEQPDLFTGAELRDFGMAAAERDRTLMVQAVDRAIAITARASITGFTAETVRAFTDVAWRDLEDVSKVIGARMRAAATRGDIYTLGETCHARRSSARARRMLVWYGKGAA